MLLRTRVALSWSNQVFKRSFRSSVLRMSDVDIGNKVPVPTHGGRVSAAVRQQEQQASSTPAEAQELSLLPPKGTRDFYPEDQRLKTWLFDNWRQSAAKYGFEEYDAPVVEHAGLYIRKAGEEVTQQLYDFKDKGGRHLSLRPEMTPSLARMVMAKRGSLTFPLKWYAIPQCWRYERMTRGRRR